MSDISGNGALQIWEGIAAVVGATFGGFVFAIGRRAGSAASRAPDAAPAGDALQREILAELKSLRTDARLQREADEDRRRDIRQRNIDEQLDDIRRELRVRRIGQNDVKHLLGETLRRLPAPDARSDRDEQE